MTSLRSSSSTEIMSLAKKAVSNPAKRSEARILEICSCNVASINATSPLLPKKFSAPMKANTIEVEIGFLARNESGYFAKEIGAAMRSLGSKIDLASRYPSPPLGSANSADFLSST
mmetsp:Transcript_26521/g.40560  ORF Transcript_26521/g.40560 Transcript_26521/m.40560 type:complete len:116 (+) Transcript_26521:309-656(+)